MGKRVDLTGQKFGKLTVIKEKGRDKNKNVLWECQCECGNTTFVTTGNLRSSTSSCGCLAKKIQSELGRKNIVKAREKTTLDHTKPYLLNDNLNKNNISGVKGVSFNRSKGRWEAKLGFKKTWFRASFKNKEDAIKQRKEWEEQYFKPFVEEYKKSPHCSAD